MKWCLYFTVHYNFGIDVEDCHRSPLFFGVSGCMWGGGGTVLFYIKLMSVKTYIKTIKHFNFAGSYNYKAPLPL